MSFLLSGFADEIDENFMIQLKSVKQLKMDYIEIRGVDGRNISTYSLYEMIKIKETLDENEIKVSAMGTPIGKVFLDDDFDAHFEMFKKLIEAAHILNTKYIRIFSFFIHKNENADDFSDEIIKRLKMLVEYAKEHDIILLHENEKDIYGDLPRRVLKLVETINDDHFRLIFDFANYIQCGVNTLEAYEMLKDYIVYFHIKDALKDGTVVPAGNGDGNIKKILQMAFNSGFKGFTSLEPHLGLFKGLQDLELNIEINDFEENGFKKFKLAYFEFDKIKNEIIKEKKMVRFGIVGIGHMGGTHAENINQGKITDGKLVAVCDIDPKRLKWAEEKLNSSVKKYSDYDEMIKDEEIDAIIIATPHYFHPPMAIKALNNGFHTLIEKPAGVYTKQVREMNEVAKLHPELVFGLMLNQRTNPVYQKAREIVTSGILGEIKRTNWIITDWYRPQAYYNQGGWRATWEGEGGGVLANQDPHQLDLWQWICGMPKKMTAFCYFGRNRDIEVENDVTAVCEYENGATGVFVTSTHDYPGTNRFEISGDNGQLIIENGKLVFKKNKVSESAFNKSNKEPWSTPGFETIEYNIANAWGNQHNEILINFVSAILNGTELLAPGFEGIKGLTIANAMLLSTFVNQTIDLNHLDEELFYNELQKRIKK
ncbi:MAG: gfo/Idh/MocA family oxidoreductase [Haloplasmataceae bacterium]|jgi:predicted dehydrogenase/sugar phosphate isomerase/epimerase|nr:gfo/Idh/MocA family oxidoreductase [Haloplasmataceae bacterium]